MILNKDSAYQTDTRLSGDIVNYHEGKEHFKHSSFSVYWGSQDERKRQRNTDRGE